MRYCRRVRPLVGSCVTLLWACVLNANGVSEGYDGSTTRTTTAATSTSSGAGPTGGTTAGSTGSTGDMTSAASDTTAGPDDKACGDPGPGEPGSLIRAVKFSGAGSQVLHGAALDPQGNIYVVGEFDGQLELDGSPMATSSAQVPFVYKFCPNGELQWARHGSSAALPLEEYKPELYRFAIAADAGGAYITGRLRGSVAFSTVSLKPAGVPAAFVATFDADGQPLKGTLLNAFAAAGMDIAVDGDEVFIAGMCHAPNTPDITGIMLSKLDTALSQPEQFRCVGGGLGDGSRKTLARSLTLRPGESTLIIGGTVIKPEDEAAVFELGPCGIGGVNQRNGYVASVSRDPADWTAPGSLWQWCRVFDTQTTNGLVLDTARDGQTIVTTLATAAAMDALGSCSSFSPTETPVGVAVSLATLDGDGSCAHAEWYTTVWGSRYLFAVEPAAPGELYLAARLDKTLTFRQLDFTALNHTFFAARLPSPPSQAITWHVRVEHTSDTQKSGATFVTANDAVVVFLGYARGSGELEVGAESVAVGSEDEHQGSPNQAYDSFLLLVRP